MKIVIYALGKIFEKNIEKIRGEEVIAFADSKYHKEELLGKRVVEPKALRALEYDYLVIFSDIHYETIKNELHGQYFIQEEKIISWRTYIEKPLKARSSVARFFRDYIRENNCERVLDMEMTALSSSFLAKEELFCVRSSVLEGLRISQGMINESLYDRIYEDGEDGKDGYDLILLGERMALQNELVEALCLKSKRMVIAASYQREKQLESMLREYDVKRFSTVYGIFWEIRFDKKNIFDDCKIYVVTHKEYNVKNDELYAPLCVGSYTKDGFLTERSGEHISHLNDKINECTALYWVWKNTSAQYVGLNHYRRYFYKNNIKTSNNRLDSDMLNDLMQQYDIILAQSVPMDGVTEFQQIKNSMNEELALTGRDLLRTCIQRHQPDYVDAFDAVMDGYNAFLCNMFVTRREILNAYCEWLFSFLIEAAEAINVDGYDGYSRRVMGFFAERMWTVWLRRQRLRIKELPYDIV